jgi:hypothetical protein
MQKQKDNSNSLGLAEGVVYYCAIKYTSGIINPSALAEYIQNAVDKGKLGFKRKHVRF